MQWKRIKYNWTKKKESAGYAQENNGTGVGFNFNLRIHESSNASLDSAEGVGEWARFPRENETINGSN